MSVKLPKDLRKRSGAAPATFDQKAIGVPKMRCSTPRAVRWAAIERP
jgi:hypothetical protein